MANPMATGNEQLFKENYRNKVVALLLIILVVIPAAATTVYNIATWDVRRPYGFILIIAGFVCFAAPKALWLLNRFVTGFGMRKMENYTANFSRAGYWLMGVGLVLTFN